MSTYQQLIDSIKDLKQCQDARLALIKEVENLTHRPLIVYATNFLKPSPMSFLSSLDDSDIIGFSDLISSIQGEEIDVFLHSPGGSAESAERIVTLLRSHFKVVRFIVPHSAYSAATLLALSGDEIIMSEKSALGPIDPQILDPYTGRYVPAQALLKGFQEARKILEKEGPKAMPVYLPLLSKYDFTIFQICENATKFSKKLASDWLRNYMKIRSNIAGKIVKFLCNHNLQLSHRRDINIEKAKKIGLKIIDLRDNENLNKAVWDLYCLIDLFFDRSNAVKLYENSRGISWSKNITIQQSQPIQIQLPLPPISPPQQPLPKSSIR